MKRFFDFIISLVVIIIFSPIIILVSILIKIKLGSPIFFKQVRPGLNGKPFKLYKFRTMSEKLSEEGILLPDEQRITVFGSKLRRMSIDELPQLINVLKGEMSLVGPRPLLMEYLPLYTERQTRRHNVKPGITGWSQVNGRNAINWEQKFELDIWYVENQSFLLDVKILWLTLIKVLKRDNINQQGQATVEKFRGVGL